MFVYLSKLLPLLIYPLGMACVLLILAIILEKPQYRAIFVLALALLWLGSNRWVSYALARSLEWQHLPSENTPNAEMIVVLGGGTESGDSPRPMTEINGAGDRVLYAAKLYRQGAAPLILLSGGNLEFSSERNETPAEAMQEILVFMNVPKDVILQQNESENTYEDALLSAQMLEDMDIKEIILVTSALHMPRAKALFENQGVEVIPAPADFTITEQNWENAFDPKLTEFIIYLLPNTSSLGLTTNALKEYLGIFVYSLRGWL